MTFTFDQVLLVVVILVLVVLLIENMITGKGGISAAEFIVILEKIESLWVASKGNPAPLVNPPVVPPTLPPIIPPAPTDPPVLGGYVLGKPRGEVSPLVKLPDPLPGKAIDPPPGLG